MTSFLNHYFVIQHVFHFFQVLKIEPNFSGIFFPYTVNEWNNLDNIIKSSKSYLMSRKTMLII